MATRARFTFADMQNLLFSHPFDGPLSVSVPKLEGAPNYRSWKRSFEIQLSSKRKLGFVDRSVPRSTKNDVNALQGDQCNNPIISWSHNNVSENIKNSILFMNTASKIGSQLEKSKYYTKLSSLWEELDSMNSLHVIPTPIAEITALLKTIDTFKDEGKFFQFFNGMDEKYDAPRSQLLMLCPLPIIEMACSMIQQEESQCDVLNTPDVPDFEASAMVVKTNTSKNLSCTAYGGKYHTSDRCWSVIRFPRWHPKYKPNAQKVNKPAKWNKQGDQLEHLLKVIPNNQVVGSMLQSARGGDTDDELEICFSGMNMKVAPPNYTIHLPTGAVATISRMKDVVLKGLTLTGVLFVPKLHHNLLSIQMFHKSIEIIRSDNALKLSDTERKSFFTAIGITHQTSCPYTPQQNTRVERKHRSVLEIAHSLHFHSGLDLKHWGDCVLIAAHLLNRTTISATGNETPYKTLFTDPLTYENLGVFGCLAFASNNEHTKDKFNPRGVYCASLGYPPSEKGSKLLNLTTNESFVSQHVGSRTHYALESKYRKTVYATTSCFNAIFLY
ncbi:uncharacterized protein LOC141685563 [Apium graveolens]|uniref:uncharacterized protein LOC141685563 n=1 Tax=Apium graveolens TaxID=4045 RepID=UPI003D7A2495